MPAYVASPFLTFAIAVPVAVLGANAVPGSHFANAVPFAFAVAVAVARPLSGSSAMQES